MTALQQHPLRDLYTDEEWSDLRQHVERGRISWPIGIDTVSKETLIEERGKVYGDPTENHRGIASMWAPMLQPYANDIARGKPLPPHVVTLMMTLVKINRMRRVYHEDNFTDAHEYLNFAQDMQSKHVETVERPVSVNLNARDYE